MLFTAFRREFFNPASKIIDQAGEPGLEPRSKAPKASVLPLHHSPTLAKALYHRRFFVAME
jgi:hypothetical protein